MQASERIMPLSIAPILGPALQRWAQPIERALHRLLIPGPVMEAFESAQACRTSHEFARRMLELLDIRYEVEERDRARIPAQGACVIVANHPFGIVEGLVLAVVLERVRPEWKII